MYGRNNVVSDFPVDFNFVDEYLFYDEDLFRTRRSNVVGDDEQDINFMAGLMEH